MKIMGVINVMVVATTGDQHQLPLMVVPGNGTSLLGRNWLSKLKLDWGVVHQLNTSHSTRKQQPQLQAVLDKYAIGFTDSHQAVKTDAAKIYVDNESSYSAGMTDQKRRPVWEGQVTSVRRAFWVS